MRAAIPLLVVCVLAALPGCAHLGTGSGDPAEMLEEANLRGSMKDYEGAYVLVKEIKLEHPDSPEAEEAFVVASECFRNLWGMNRFTNPDSVWNGPEKLFMFEWTAEYFEDGTFPKEQVDHLMLGHPWDVFVMFDEWGRSDPRVSRWRLTGIEDNGRMEEVLAEPLEGSEASS